RHVRRRRRAAIPLLLAVDLALEAVAAAHDEEDGKAVAAGVRENVGDAARAGHGALEEPQHLELRRSLRRGGGRRGNEQKANERRGSRHRSMVAQRDGCRSCATTYRPTSLPSALPVVAS